MGLKLHEFQNKLKEMKIKTLFVLYGQFITGQAEINVLELVDIFNMSPHWPLKGCAVTIEWGNKTWWLIIYKNTIGNEKPIVVFLKPTPRHPCGSNGDAFQIQGQSSVPLGVLI